MFLYGGDSLVVMGDIMKVMEGLHHRISLRISGMTARQVREEVRECSLAMEELEAASMWPMNDYSHRRQATIENYIGNHPIYDIYPV